MRRIPNFVLLRAFEAAARLQSFTLAAHELHLTPSAISHQVKELEELFAQPLFVRRHRKVVPTPAGQRLQRELTQVLDALEACCNDVALAPEEQVLAVHCAPSLAVKWLGPRLPAFMRDHPDITIRLSTGAEPVDLAMARDVDVTISYGAALERPGLEVEALGREIVVPLCSPGLVDTRVAARSLITRLTLIESQLSPVTWREWFSLNGLSPPPRARLSFDRAALAISAAVDGMGVALESTRLAERELARGELVELGVSVFERMARENHFLSVRANERQSGKVKAFRSWLQGQLAAGPPNPSIPPGASPGRPPPTGPASGRTGLHPAGRKGRSA